MNVPTPSDFRARLEPFSMTELHVITELSGVPMLTLYKIKRGETADPGLSTAAKVYPVLSKAHRLVMRNRSRSR